MHPIIDRGIPLPCYQRAGRLGWVPLEDSDIAAFSSQIVLETMPGGNARIGKQLYR